MATTVLRCECGFEVSADEEAVLVAEVRRHAREMHGMTLSVDEARAVVRRADAASLPRATARSETGIGIAETRYAGGSRRTVNQDEGRRR